MTENPYRDLPPVDGLADRLESRLPRPLRLKVARQAIDLARSAIENGNETDPVATAASLARALERSAGTPVINATGVMLHTNLGRARWSERAAESARVAALHPSNLEMDIREGTRSKRGSYVSELLMELTGAEAALIVNNNASGLLLALAATAAGRSTLVSRGELIEIGGSYRLPEVMAASRTRMVEVGTTNRTRAEDYLTATQLYEVGAILKVHPSNYSINGFTSEASLGALKALAGGATVIHDTGSGLLDGSASWVPDWLSDEPSAAASLREGADLVLFSGDKLLGGPQAGIIVGAETTVRLLSSHPLARALRVDGVVYAALAATLEAYAEGTPEEIPFWRQALTNSEDLKNRAETMAEAIEAEVEEGSSTVGGGSAPNVSIPSHLVRIRGRDDLFEQLLDLESPILGRRDSGDLLLDPRTITPEEDTVVIDGIRQCL